MFKASLLAVCISVGIAPSFGQQTDETTERAFTPATTGIVSVRGVPKFVRFTGTLSHPSLTPTVRMLFSLYEERESGTSLWQEAQDVQTDAQAHFTVLLGSTRKDGLPLKVFSDGKAHWLGMQLQPGQGQEGLQQPTDDEQRILLVGVPYALKAADADTLGGKPASAYMLAPKKAGTASAKVEDKTVDATADATINAAITGTGATNYIARWLSGTALGNSLLFQTTTSIGIGTTAPVAKLHVVGSVPATTIDGLNTAPTGSTFGVLGQANSTVGTGVYGKAIATSGPTVGVRGQVSSVNGIGGVFSNAAGGTAVKALNGSASFAGTIPASILGASLGIGVVGMGADTGSTGVIGTAGCAALSCMTTIMNLAGGVGVFGWGLQSYDTGVEGWVNDGVAVSGRATGGVAINGYSESGAYATISGYNSGSGNLALSAGGPNGACTVDGSGNLACSGSKSAAVRIATGQQVAMYAVESPENWFEDFGSGKLVSGIGIVNLDQVFVQTVNSGLNYHVFVTPRGDCKGLYVAQETPGSFQVRELGGGRSSVSFDYRIVVRRRGYENVRMADVTSKMKKPSFRAKTGEVKRIAVY